MKSPRTLDYEIIEGELVDEPQSQRTVEEIEKIEIPNTSLVPMPRITIETTKPLQTPVNQPVQLPTNPAPQSKPAPQPERTNYWYVHTYDKQGIVTIHVVLPEDHLKIIRTNRLAASASRNCFWLDHGRTLSAQILKTHICIRQQVPPDIGQVLAVTCVDGAAEFELVNKQFNYVHQQ